MLKSCSKLLLAKIKDRSAKIAVCGMGSAGHGIAQTLSSHGFDTYCQDLSQANLDRAMDRIAANLERNKEKVVSKTGHFSYEMEEVSANIMSRLIPTIGCDDIHHCDIIIESLPEEWRKKKTFYEQIDEIMLPSTIFATNTSSFSVAQLSEITNRADRFCGMHFHSPVPEMELVEVVETNKTSAMTRDCAVELAQQMNKEALVCPDSPGFIVTRLLMPYIAEAMVMIECGRDVAEVDNAMKWGIGVPMGPLEMADYIGLDTCLKILQTWQKRYCENPHFFTPQILVEKVKLNFLGRKNGKGFYVWDEENDTPLFPVFDDF
eukprot:TRINITY_DN171610_c0_g1_i1.p1 TRINITY_DN171610_c0_g1~~TRINITY_DN171610_c0_g1_i1.p1  ORF type:complete len:320 (-),score=86.73 TRINITY_DN171610_c0_g1_i1:72-1031(-)